jgi:alternate signal-mediated exported protein
MNKLFKGAIAGAAGVALLLGGAGTFALWNHTADVGTDAVIDAGHLRFGTVPDGVWYLNGSATPLTHEQVEDLALVPGDILEYVVDGVPVVAHGTNLKATVGFDLADVVAVTGGDGHPLTEAEASDLFRAALTPEYTIDGVATDTLDVTGDTTMTPKTFDIVVRLTFDPKTEQQDAMGGRVNLAGFKLTLDQVAVPGQAVTT